MGKIETRAFRGVVAAALRFCEDYIIIFMRKLHYIMAHDDFQRPTPMELFTRLIEPPGDSDDRLYLRMRRDEGRPIIRLDQLEILYDDLFRESDLKLEFDSFLPIRVQHFG